MNDVRPEAHLHQLSGDYAGGLSETLADHLTLKACRHGYMLYFNTDLYVGDSLDLYGEWAEVETELFARIVKPGMTVVEAGANLGTHTLPLAKMAGPSGHVYAFEPQRRIFQILCANMALNDIGNVHAYQAGLGDKAATMFLAQADYTRQTNFAGLALADKGSEEVDVRTIDSLQLKTLDFLKIDVEAMEELVLRGASRSIAFHRPVIFIENDRTEESSSVIRVLFDMKYRCWWHISDPFNRRNFFGIDHDVWNGLGESNNMLCFPEEGCTPATLAIVEGLAEVKSADETWETALAGKTRIVASG